MTIRNLDLTLAPKSVALIGASDRENSVGRVVLENVRAGFSGAIYPVNLKYDVVLGLRCYRRVADLPEPPDLAIVMTPAATVPDLTRDLGERGCRAVVVLSAGVDATSGLRQAMLEAARLHTLRVIGPNTIGLVAPRVNLNASFAHLSPLRGRLGLISQSGAIVSSMIDWAVAEGVGFSQIFSLGDMADVDIGDCLDLLAMDDQTDAILMYVEAVTNPRKFMSSARAASRIKPVIAVKPGRHAEAARAAATHTGALAGADRIVEAVLHRAGIIRVDDLEDLFDAAEVTGRYRPITRGRTAIVTNGGGAGVLAVDELLDQGASLAALSARTLDRLDEALPRTWSRGNPIDIIGDATPERYRAAVEAAAQDDGVDAVLVMNCPTGIANPLASAQAVAYMTRHGVINGKPLLTCWLGQTTAEPARSLLQAAGVGSFDTPAHAAQAVALLTRWNALREQLERVPEQMGEVDIDIPPIRKILNDAAAEGRTLLTEPEAKLVLQHCGISVPETVSCATEEEVEKVSARMLLDTPRVVVKMLSKRITHKSDIGGVALNLSRAEDARAAAQDIRSRFTAAYPDLAIDGFAVQPMVTRKHGRELIAGITTDPIFGPVVVFGAGGTSVEVVDDTAIGLVPLDTVLAGDIVARTRISRLLEGYRDVPAADRVAVLHTLVALSELAISLPGISSVDINPLVASADGVVALDARIEIDPRMIDAPAPSTRLILSPYPSGEESDVVLDGTKFTMRPIRPVDASLYPAFLQRMDPEDMRRRFLVPMPTLSKQLLVRLTQLDYDRDIAFVALDRATGELAGIVRYSADPDHRTAEYGVLVRSDLKGRGLGRALMRRLIEYARRSGIEELFGLVLPDNARMLSICRDLGFAVTERVPGENLVRATLTLAT
jgi:acetyltransferase